MSKSESWPTLNADVLLDQFLISVQRVLWEKVDDRAEEETLIAERLQENRRTFGTHG